MAQRRHHYERAFESYLRGRRIPYVAVDEARKALLPPGRGLSLADPAAGALKSFDFVIYGQSDNLLVEVKGRKLQRSVREGFASGGRQGPRRLENWVTEDDVASLSLWERLFGIGYRAAFVFVYWCDEQPPDGLFEEIIACRGRWYALRAVPLGDYRAAMKPRSARWGTVNLSTADFDRLCRPLAPADGIFDGDAGPDLPAFEPFERVAALAAG